MRRLRRCIREWFWNLISRLWWRTRSLRARIVCWYINRIWMPRQPEIVLSVAERQDALAITNEILQELEAEEQQCGR